MTCLKPFKILLLSFCFLILASCAAQNNFLNKVKDEANKMTNQAPGEKPQNITESEAAQALKEALDNGAKNTVDMVSKADGYMGNPEIKIPFPPDARKVETKLRDLGMDNKVDQAVESINRAAEDAANAAKPILVDAIKRMTVRDAINIVKGNDDAATQYLKRTTNDAIYDLFKPKIGRSLDKVNATKHWGTVMTTYNKLPFVEKVNPDLEDYVTKMALKGLYTMIAKEEKKIRENRGQ